MIQVKSLEFLKKYPSIWNEDNWDDLTDICDGEYHFSIPSNLDPSAMDTIDYSHGTCPDELKPLIYGSFFIDNIKEFINPFEVEFYTFYDAEEFYFYKWSGEKLYKATVEVTSRYYDIERENDPDYEESGDCYEITGPIVDDMKSGCGADSEYCPKDDDWRVIYEKKKPIKKMTKKTSNDKSKPGENYGSVIGVLKLSKSDGMTIKEISETTKLSKPQVVYQIRKAIKSCEVKETEKGVYEIVKENKGTE